MGLPRLMHFPLAAHYAMQRGLAIRRSGWDGVPVLKTATTFPFTTALVSSSGTNLAWITFEGGLWFYHTWQLVSGKAVNVSRVVTADDFKFADLTALDWTTDAPGCAASAECDCEAIAATMLVPPFPSTTTPVVEPVLFDLNAPNARKGVAECASSAPSASACGCTEQTPTANCGSGSFAGQAKACVPITLTAGPTQPDAGGTTGKSSGGGAGGGTSGIPGSTGGSGGSGGGGGGGGGGGDGGSRGSCAAGEHWDSGLAACVPDGLCPTIQLDVEVEKTHDNGTCVEEAIVTQGWLGSVNLQAPAYPSNTYFLTKITWLGAIHWQGYLKHGDTKDFIVPDQTRNAGSMLGLRVTAHAPYDTCQGDSGILSTHWEPQCVDSLPPPPPFELGPKPRPEPYQPGDCEEGYHWDAELEECVSDTSCPDGQVYDEGRNPPGCRPECDGDNEAYNYTSNVCECDEGYHRDESGDCVEDPTCDAHEHYDEGSDACVCDDGYHDDAGTCVEDPTCDAHEHYDEGTDACVCDDGYHDEEGTCVEDPTCPANAHYDVGTDACVCDDGYTDDGSGNCISIPSCSDHAHYDEELDQCVCDEGYEIYEGICVPVCGEHQHREAGSCVCDSGYEEIDGNCLAECGAHAHRDGTDCVCDSGYYDDGGDCVEEPTCGEHAHVDESHVCVCDSGYVDDGFGNCVSL